MRRLLTRFPAALALGAATAFFLDPRYGARRRHDLSDWVLRALRRGRWLFVDRTAVAPMPPATDDVTVKQRILTEALGDIEAGSRSVEVEVHDGVVTLSGTVPSSTLADDLIARVREVPGVRDVTPGLTVAATGDALDQGV